MTFTDKGSPAGIFHTHENFATPRALFPHRRIDVFVPRDYETSKSRYPVLYMHDGNTIFVKGGLANLSWNMAEVLSDSYSQGAVKPLIVVAIWPVQRNREYTHVRWSAAECCDLPAYAECLAKWVKPFIDQNYRTLPEANNTMMVGASHGGLASFFITNRYPESFGFCAGMSSSFWAGIDDGSEFPIVRPCPQVALRGSDLISLVQSTLIQPSLRPKLYLDWGLVRTGGPHNEFIEERATVRGREMARILQEDFGYRIGSDLEIVEDPAGEHQESSWGRRMPKVLRWFEKDRTSRNVAESV